MVEPAAVGLPAGSGGDGDVIRFDGKHVVDGHPVIQVKVDVGHGLNFVNTVVAHPGPFAQAGQFALTRDTSTGREAGLSQHDVITTATERTRGFETGRAGSDHEDC